MENKIALFALTLNLEPNEVELFMDSVYDRSKTYYENKEMLIKFTLEQHGRLSKSED